MIRKVDYDNDGLLSFEEFKAANPGGYEEIYAEDGRRKMRGCYEVMRVLGCVDGPPLTDPEVIDKEVREELERVVRSNVRTGDLREAGRWLRVLGEGVGLDFGYAGGTSGRDFGILLLRDGC